jgi:hypothetical protein
MIDASRNGGVFFNKKFYIFDKNLSEIMTTAIVNKTKDVFGIMRELPLNYIVREADNVFLDSLDRSHHVVIYGSSKQGKTSLRKKNLKSEEYILVHCSNTWDLYHININILKQAGYSISVTEKKTTTGKAKVKASFGFNLFTKVEAETEAEGSISKELTTKELELDPEDVNDVITALNKLKLTKFIVLEDFHYLKPETQINFAIELKAFTENSDFTFIIVGVWLEENRLISLNGDLAGRVKSVNADKWEEEELRNLIVTGEQLLNVKFSDDAITALIQASLQNVHIVQEVCYMVCSNNGIKETVNGKSKELDCDNINVIIDNVIDQHAGRYNSFITSFADGFQSTELEMYKWILYSILTSPIDKQEQGLKRNAIKKLISEKHPKGESLNDGNLTQALKSVASLQIKKRITPIIVDYDSANLKLNIVDKGFIIWLNNQDNNEVLSNAGLPTIEDQIEENDGQI